MNKPACPKKLTAKVKKLNRIKQDVYLLSFDSAYLAEKSYPGQFLHIKIAKTILRRPFSIHCIRGKTVDVLFRIRGRGTEILSKYKKGEELNIIGPLGRGFDIRPKTRNILVAGGLGVAPLIFLAKKLKEIPNPKSQILNTILLGVKTKDEVLCEKEFKNLGFKVYVATEDGSKGYKGTVDGLLKKTLTTNDYSLTTNLYACGPKEMFLAISKVIKKYPEINCQVSYEQFMGCGLGICCGCAIQTKSGYKKVCKDGPVFDLNDIF